MAKQTKNKPVDMTKANVVSPDVDNVTRETSAEILTYQGGQKVLIKPTPENPYMKKEKYKVDGNVANALIAKGFAVAIS